MNREQIAALIPHKGPMCLLTEMVAWDSGHIHCRSTTHRAADHPLAVNGRLQPVALVEYAAQTVALHGSLRVHDERSDHSPSRGRLVALKQVRFEHYSGDLQTLPALNIHAECELGGTSGLIYAFRVTSGKRSLAAGQLTVRLG